MREAPHFLSPPRAPVEILLSLDFEQEVTEVVNWRDPASRALAFLHAPKQVTIGAISPDHRLRCLRLVESAGEFHPLVSFHGS